MSLDLAPMLDDVSVDAPWSLVERLARQPRERPQDADAGAEMIAGALRDAGIPFVVHEPRLYLSLPIAAGVAAGGETFEAKPPAFAASRPDGVTGRLIHMADDGGGTPLDRTPSAGASLEAARGRIAVIEGFALPNFVAGLEAAGALAVIAVNPGERIHWGTVSTIWGTPEPEDLDRLPRIPSVAVNRASGRRLIALAAEGAEATVATTLETGWHAQKLVVADIPGTGDTDEFVLLHGHHDAWREGVGDNGTGDACMLGVARALWAHRAALRRSVRVAWWPGHSTGRYGGSAWFADAFALDIDAHCVAHLNCDSPGCRWATSYESVAATAEMAPLVREVVRAVTGQEATCKRPQRNSDYTFFNLGVSGLFNASSMMPRAEREARGYYVVGGCGGNIAWHTEDDTLEVADRDVLETDIRLYLAAVLRLACDPVLPIDWREAVADMGATLARRREAAGALLDLAPAEAELTALGGALDALHAGIADGSAAPEAANPVLRGLARILVPLEHVRGPRWGHDPALNVPPLPGLAAAETLAAEPEARRGFALAQLVRGRNRAVAALREARALVERATAS